MNPTVGEGRTEARTKPLYDVNYMIVI